MPQDSEHWSRRAACTESAEAMFGETQEQNRIKSQCGGCSVRIDCLSEALDRRIEFGVWGGMTERERRALLRRRPNVASWRSVLETMGNATAVQDLPRAG